MADLRLMDLASELGAFGTCVISTLGHAPDAGRTWWTRSENWRTAHPDTPPTLLHPDVAALLDKRDAPAMEVTVQARRLRGLVMGLSAHLPRHPNRDGLESRAREALTKIEQGIVPAYTAIAVAKCRTQPANPEHIPDTPIDPAVHDLSEVADELRREAAETPALWFDEHGHLNQSGSVALPHCLGALSDQLRLFLARLDSCERNDAGDYLLRDARAGNLGGMRVLWDNVVLLAQASIAKTLPMMTPDQPATMKRDGVFVTTTGPTRNAQPLADALRQLLFSILYNADGTWVSEIPSATVAKIRTIGDELTLHRAAWERSEGGTTRTPTVSVSPDLLDWLQRAAAAADPGVIGGATKLPKTRRGFQRLAETTTRDQPIIAAINDGKSYRQAARECSVGKTTVERVAKAYGLTGHAPETVPLDGTLQENLSVRGKPGKRRSR